MRTYSQAILNEAVNYVNNYDVIYGDPVPSKAGLCRALNVGKTTIYTWAQTHEAFAHIIDQLNLERERKLLHSGLLGRYNSAIAKVVMAEFGYGDRTKLEVDEIDLKKLTDEQLAYVVQHGRLPDPA